MAEDPTGPTRDVLASDMVELHWIIYEALPDEISIKPRYFPEMRKPGLQPLKPKPELAASWYIIGKAAAGDAHVQVLAHVLLRSKQSINSMPWRGLFVEVEEVPKTAKSGEVAAIAKRAVKDSSAYNRDP